MAISYHCGIPLDLATLSIRFKIAITGSLNLHDFWNRATIIARDKPQILVGGQTQWPEESNGQSHTFQANCMTMYPMSWQHVKQLRGTPLDGLGCRTDRPRSGCWDCPEA